MISPERQRENIVSLLEKLQNRDFWGTVEIQLNCGKIVVVRVTESHKVEDLEQSCEAKTKT